MLFVIGLLGNLIWIAVGVWGLWARTKVGLPEWTTPRGRRISRAYDFFTGTTVWMVFLSGVFGLVWGVVKAVVA